MPEVFNTIWKNPYRDGKTLAIGVPLITLCMTLIGTNHDLSDAEQLLQLAIKLAYNTLAVGLSWIVTRQLIVYLDDEFPWRQEEEVRRLLRQIPLVFLGMNIVYFSITALRVYLFEFWPISWTEIWLTDYPLAILFLVLVNFWYYYQWQQRKQLVINRYKEVEEPNKKIEVLKGRVSVLLDPEAISYAFREHEINYVMDADGLTYLWDDSLAALESALPKFFRLNRQFLVNRKSVLTYVVKDNRNLSVELKFLKKEPLEVNKNRAAAFRRWLNQS